jgi:hypothetical protein
VSQVSTTLYACWQRIKNSMDNKVEVGKENEVYEMSDRARMVWMQKTATKRSDHVLVPEHSVLQYSHVL